MHRGEGSAPSHQHIYIYIYIYMHIYIDLSLSLSLSLYIYRERERDQCIHIHIHIQAVMFVVRMELPCVVLWRPEALACRVPIPPETFLCANRMTGRSIDSWSNKRTQQKDTRKAREKVPIPPETLPLTRPVWDSNPRPPASEPTLLPTGLSYNLI